MKNYFFPGTLSSLLIGCLSMPLLLGAVVANAQLLVAETTEEGVLVRENNDRVLFYQRKTKTLNGAYARANYVHPLFGLDGTVLTEEFPEDPPHNHWHQRGIFWAWHQVLTDGNPMGDMWDCEDFKWDVRSVLPQRGVKLFLRPPRSMLARGWMCQDR